MGGGAARVEGEEMGQSSAGTPLAGAAPRITVAAVRSQIASGDLALAREMYRALLDQSGPIVDVLLTEALLDEAEGNLDAALARLGRIVATARRSVHAKAQSARVLWRLGRAGEAEAAALAALGLDAVNLGGLTVLADIYAKAGRTGDRLDAVCRLALCAGAPGSAVWSAIAELSGAGRWEDTLQVLDRRGDLLAEQRVTIVRAEALLALGRQREAVAGLLEALAKGQGRPQDTVDRLIARPALTAAALFLAAAIEEGHLGPAARAPAITAARQAHEGAILEDSPFVYADAARALEILCPDEGSPPKAVARAAAFLLERAHGHLARDEFSAAADHLIQAGRLRPEDPGILRLLADAAAKAGRPDRHLDTLLRIHRLSASAGSLLAAADGAYAAGRWGVLAALMTETPAVDPSRALTDAADRMLAGLRARLEGLAREGNGEEGVAMVAALAPWIDVSKWPEGAISRLLAAAKRRMRGPRISVDPTALGRLAAAFLVVDPADLDVGRLAARLHLRFRRFGEATALLAGVLEADPHVARDWVDLALAHHQLGDSGRRDACARRALVIAPTIMLPPPLDAVRVRMEPP